MKPITACVAFAALISSAGIAALHLVVSCDQAFHDITAFEHLLCSAPAVLFALGAAFLMLGSRLARMGLAMLFSILAVCCVFIAVYGLLLLHIPVATMMMPAAAGLLFLVPSAVLLFSKNLGDELAALRRARHA